MVCHLNNVFADDFYRKIYKLVSRHPATVEAKLSLNPVSMWPKKQNILSKIFRTLKKLFSHGSRDITNCFVSDVCRNPSLKIRPYENFSFIYYRITKKSFALFKKIELDKRSRKFCKHGLAI